MKKPVLTFFVLLFIGSSALIAQQVVSSAGADYKSENVSLSWTLGEPVIETISNNNLILTQGFQQGYISSNSIEDIFIGSLKLKIYPNPTPDDLNLLLSDSNFSDLKYCLHSMEGKVLSQGPLLADLTKIDMYSYPHGVYLLRIIKKSGEPVQSFRVVKQ